MLGAFGWMAYWTPIFLFWMAARAWAARKALSSEIAFATHALFLPLGGFFLAALGWGLAAFNQSDIAGGLGLWLARSMSYRVGFFGSWAMLAGLGAFWLWMAFDVPWGALTGRTIRLIQEDWKSWRREWRLRRAAVAEQSASAGGAVSAPRVKIEKPANGNGHGVRPPESEETERIGPVKITVAPVEPPIRGQARPAPDAPREGAAAKWTLPSLDLLNRGSGGSEVWAQADVLEGRGQDLVRALANFEVLVDLEGIVPGPVVTRYDVVPKPGVKVTEIVNLTNDIALALRVASVRVLGPIAGKGAIGIEVPNPKATLVRLRDVLETSMAREADDRLVFAIGRSASGEGILADLTDMPHLLVAGATNSGKSVLIHAMIVSYIYRMTPDELKLVLIDPKRLELPFYEGVPHLFDPRKSASDVTVITDFKEASKTLAAMVDLMEARYERFAQKNVRNIEAYNKVVRQGSPGAVDAGAFAPEPYVVVIIDELADLMLVAGKEVEHNVQRLAQMARAVGIHLILATQRPSVDVITGVIKANLPARIALQVVSKVDSRVILDAQGAEDLLGEGDLLYLAAGAQRPARIQGAYVSDGEIQKVVQFWKEQGGPDYPEPAVLMGIHNQNSGGQGQVQSREEVENFLKALKLIQERRRVSQDLLKAHFGSSARATDILSRLEVGGYIFKPEGTNRWEIRYDRIEEYLKERRID